MGLQGAACKICARETELLRDGQSGKDYYRCATCALIFMDERYYVPTDKEIERYSEHNNSADNSGYVQMFRDFLEVAVRPYTRQAGEALDFGCGPGPVLASLLKDEGFRVDIYDPYFAPARVFEDKQYDLITSTEVFEHIADPLGTMKLLAGLLKEGAVCAVMTLFHYNDAQAFLGWWYRRDPTHICFYTPRTFEVLAEKCGLRVLFANEKNVCVLKRV